MPGEALRLAVPRLEPQRQPPLVQYANLRQPSEGASSPGPAPPRAPYESSRDRRLKLWSHRRWSQCHRVIALIVLLGVAGCSEKKQELPRVTPPLTLDMLRNAEYASQWPSSGRARLVNGEFREPAAPGAATGIRVRTTDFHAFGDLDGDSIADAVMVLESDPGGSGVFFDLVPVLNRAGKPLTLASIALGDRVQISGVAIRDGRVEVDLLQQGPNDPQCCPTQSATADYHLDGDHLVAEGDQDPSLSSADPVTR